MRARTVYYVLAGVALLVACGGGGAGTFDGFDFYEPNGGAYENPGPGQDKPAVTNDTAKPSNEAPPKNTENPGTFGGGGGGCPPCDAVYTCVSMLTENGQTKTDQFSSPLATSNGECLGHGGPLVAFGHGHVMCGGDLVSDDGTKVGTWTASASGIDFQMDFHDGDGGAEVTGTIQCTKVESTGTTGTTPPPTPVLEAGAIPVDGG